MAPFLHSVFHLCSVLREKIEDGYLSVNNAKDIIDKNFVRQCGKNIRMTPDKFVKSGETFLTRKPFFHYSRIQKKAVKKRSRR